MQNNTLSRAELDATGDVLDIHYGDVLIKYGSILDATDNTIPHIISGHESTNYDYLQDGDIIVADTAEDKTVGKTIELLNISGRKIEAGLHTVPCRPLFPFASMYLGYYMNTPHYHKQLIPLMQGIKVLSISKGNISKTEISSPQTIAEQEKISRFLYLLDQRAAAQSKIIDALKKYKRGVVDGIFSRKLNFSYPQTWAELEISELFMPISDKGYSDKIVLTIVQGEGTMPRDSVDRRIAYDKSTISSYKRVLPNDFILHLRSFEGGLEIVNEEGVVSPAYTILRARNEIIPLFFYTFFRSYWFINSKLRISVEGIRDGKSINMNTFWHIKVPVPSIEEQRHISALISSIDNRIKIAEFEYKRLLQIRVGLMQQLFI